MTVRYFRHLHHHHHRHHQHQQSLIFSLILLFLKNILKYLRNITKEHMKQIKKIKVRHRTSHEYPEGEQSYSSIFSITSALDGDGCSTLGMGPLTPGKETLTHHIGGWMCPRAGLHWCGNRYKRKYSTFRCSL